MVSAVVELAVGVASITIAGLLLLHAWDRQHADYKSRTRRRTRRS